MKKYKKNWFVNFYYTVFDRVLFFTVVPQISNSKQGVPGAKNVPVVGKLFKGTAKSDTMSELLVFIAPRIL